MDVRPFVELGYSPYEKQFDMVTREGGSGFGASHTMEYSFSCFAVAAVRQTAGRVGSITKGFPINTQAQSGKMEDEIEYS